MIIEHNGKTIDTEREVRRCDTNSAVRYVGSLADSRHIFEWGQGCWEAFTVQSAVHHFENVPQKHKAWVNVYPNRAVHSVHYPTKERADAVAQSDRIACCRIEWGE